MTKIGLSRAYRRIESAVSGPMPLTSSNCSRKTFVSSDFMRFILLLKLVARKLRKFLSLFALMLKYPAGLINDASCLCDILCRVFALRHFLYFKLLIAFSTFPQFVFCVRMAPTAISKGVSPGHHCWGPRESKSVSYISTSAFLWVVLILFAI